MCRRCRRNRRTIFSPPQLAVRGGNRLCISVVSEGVDEGIELGHRFFALSSGELDLVGELLELGEGRALVEGRWILCLCRIAHDAQ